MATDIILSKLGPLAALVGIWEGSKGKDVAPSDDRGTETNHFKERLEFTPFGPVNNHEQELYGLHYKTHAYKADANGDFSADAFHEELGYWLWDAKEKQIMRCFMVPRGVTVLAGGTVDSDAKEFSLSATVGSTTYGICSNLFLDREFKTVRYDLKVTFHGPDRFTYEENTQLHMKGREKLFDHTDSNTVHRVKV